MNPHSKRFNSPFNALASLFNGDVPHDMLRQKLLVYHVLGTCFALMCSLCLTQEFLREGQKMEVKPLRMDVVIDGLRYRTDNAILLAYYKYTQGSFICDYYYLYKTPNGNYFYQQRNTDSSSGKLKPLSETAAIDFYERIKRNEHGKILVPNAFPSSMIKDA